MPIRYSAKCNVCKLTKVDTQLKNRIYKSTYYDKETGMETISEIGRDYRAAFHYNSLRTHCAKHQYANKKTVAIARAKAGKPSEIKPQPQQAIQNPQNMGTQDADRTFDEVIELGREKLKSGEMQLTANHLLTAAKSKSELALKRKDQQMNLQKMIWSFASGEQGESSNYDRKLVEGQEATAYNAAAITSRNVEEGQTRSSTVHKSDARDATPLRTSEILAAYTDGIN